MKYISREVNGGEPLINVLSTRYWVDPTVLVSSHVRCSWHCIVGQESGGGGQEAALFQHTAANC